MDSLSDKAIVERVLDGDVDAFSVVVARYQDRMYSAVLNYVSNRDDAADVTQEAFVKAFSKLNSFDSASALYTWLYRIAINTAIDHLRKRKSSRTESLDDNKYTEVGFEPVARDPSTDPERMLATNEQQRALRKAIASLSDKLRSVAVLHDVEGLSQEEVAQILKVPIGTVKSRVSRARAEIRRLLDSQLGESV